MVKVQVATENAATMVMPLPSGERHENKGDGKRRERGLRASIRKNRARPIKPRASSSDERNRAMSMPAAATSTTLMARQASAG